MRSPLDLNSLWEEVGLGEQTVRKGFQSGHGEREIWPRNLSKGRGLSCLKQLHDSWELGSCEAGRLI